MTLLWSFVYEEDITVLNVKIEFVIHVYKVTASEPTVIVTAPSFPASVV